MSEKKNVLAQNGYELTHDRLIKPIKDANNAWKKNPINSPKNSIDLDLNWLYIILPRERNKKSVKFLSLFLVAVIAIGVIFFINPGLGPKFYEDINSFEDIRLEAKSIYINCKFRDRENIFIKS